MRPRKTKYDPWLDQQVPDNSTGVKGLPEDWVLDALKESRIDPLKGEDRPPVIFSILEKEAMRFVERRVFTAGNFSAIIGKAKSKKTFLLSAISACILGNRTMFEKLKGEQLDGRKSVLYFDTEQGDWDAWQVTRRIIRMAGIPEMDYFKSFNLRKYDPVERCEIIEFALMSYGDECTLAVIDGIADLANAINDEEEATRVVSLLMRWTKDYNIHIANVIHQNKADNFATGHLGSSITKKAEVIISVTKDLQDVASSTVSCENIRGTMEFQPFKLVISGEGMPVIDDIHIEVADDSDFFKTNNEVPF